MSHGEASDGGATHVNMAPVSVSTLPRARSGARRATQRGGPRRWAKNVVKYLRYAARQSRSVRRLSARDDCGLTVLLACEMQRRVGCLSKAGAASVGALLRRARGARVCCSEPSSVRSGSLVALNAFGYMHDVVLSIRRNIGPLLPGAPEALDSLAAIYRGSAQTVDLAAIVRDATPPVRSQSGFHVIDRSDLDRSGRVDFVEDGTPDLVRVVAPLGQFAFCFPNFPAASGSGSLAGSSRTSSIRFFGQTAFRYAARTSRRSRSANGNG